MPELSIGEAKKIVGGLSQPSKMPGFGYSLPAKECTVGGKLRDVEGSVCHGCYAMKGRYVFPNVQDALYRRLEAIQDMRWPYAMARLINHYGDRGHDCFRWHDSGDLQGAGHLGAIVLVCELSPSVRHWIPTREYAIVRDYVKAGGHIPDNLTVRLSAHMVNQRKVPLGEKLGLTISTVSTETAPEGAHECPARFQDNSCGDCRACWDGTVPHVDYHIH